MYLVAPAPITADTRRMAVLLETGDDAQLSHGSALTFAGVHKNNFSFWEVTTPRRLVRLRNGVIRRRSEPEPDEVTVRDGIRTSGVHRATLDLAGAHPKKRVVERVMEEIHFLGITDTVSFQTLFQRYPRHPGIPIVQSILEAETLGTTRTLNDFEEMLFALCDELGLPRPAMNQRMTVHGRTIVADGVWVDAGLIAEMDGAAHKETSRFYSDRRRDRGLQADDWRTIRITWKDVTEPRERRLLCEDLRKLLAPERIARRIGRQAA